MEEVKTRESDRTSQDHRFQMAHPAKSQLITLLIDACLFLEGSQCMLGAALCSLGLRRFSSPLPAESKEDRGLGDFSSRTLPDEPDTEALIYSLLDKSHSVASSGCRHGALLLVCTEAGAHSKAPTPEIGRSLPAGNNQCISL